MEIKAKINKLRGWVIRNKASAIGIPMILGLCSFFVVENVKDMDKATVQDQTEINAFDPDLPGKAPELQEVDNYTLWSEREKLEKKKIREMEPPEMFKKNESDSIDEILRRLESISIEDGAISNGPPSATQSDKVLVAREKKDNDQERKRKILADRLAYREMLRKGRESMKGTSREAISKESIGPEEAAGGSGIAIRAVVYKDQFVISNEVAQLMLTEDVVIDDKFFKKNTLLYALVNIKENRVHFDINNINHVPVSVTAKDYNDGMEGLYSKRAGALWREFSADTQGDGIRNAASVVGTKESRIVSSVASSFSNFFSRKKLKQRDKVLLVNDRELLLIFK